MFRLRCVIVLGTILVTSPGAVRAQPRVAVEWRPQQQEVAPGGFVDIAFYAVPLEYPYVELEGVQVILAWDETKLELVGHVDPCDDSDCAFICPERNTTNWYLSGFPADCAYDGLNAPCGGGLPENDGDAFFSTWVWLYCNGQMPPLPVIPPSGFWLTTFRFRVLADSGAATVDILNEVGDTRSLVVGFDGIWDYNALWEIRPAAQIEIVPCSAPLAEAAGPTYLQVTPRDGIDPIALQVVGDPLDPEIDCVARYVQAPTRMCVGGSGHGNRCTDDADCPGGACRAFSTLGSDPVRLMPDEWGTVFVRGAAIRPAKRYDIRAECGPDGESAPSDPVAVETWAWGDVDHSAVCGFGSTNVGAACVRDSDCPGGLCVGGSFQDISCCVQAYKGVFSAGCTLPATDMRGPGCVPNLDVNFIDINAAVEGFKRIPFSCTETLCR